MNKTVFVHFGTFTLALLMLLSLSLCLVPSVAADSTDTYLVDDADILTDAEEASLASRLKEMSQRYAMDFVIVTTDTLNGKSEQAFADDYFDYHGYGQGSRRSGVLLLCYINDYDQIVCISTSGDAIDAITDRDIEYLLDCMEPYCANDNDAQAFSVFLTKSAQIVDDYYYVLEHGEPYNKIWILVGIIAGVIVAAIVTGSMRAKLKSVRAQRFAGNYIREGSFDLTNARDTYLYSTIQRVRRDTDSSRGGSSTHRSSSGASHGGGSRRM